MIGIITVLLFQKLMKGQALDVEFGEHQEVCLQVLFCLLIVLLPGALCDSSK